MKDSNFDLEHVLHELKHFLPSQFPLKDFIHHNTLHAFQQQNFFTALQTANETFGYKTSLSLTEYRNLYKTGKISEKVIDWVLYATESELPFSERKKRMMNEPEDATYSRQIGAVRGYWKTAHKLDLNTIVHLNLFKLVGSYLDQGISAKPFPNSRKGLLNAVSSLERYTMFEFFHSKRVKELLFKKHRSITELLDIIVGNKIYYEQYLFDQQFAHPGWSGMVSVIESKPSTLHAKKVISFEDFVYLELLLEIDALDKKFGEAKWEPLANSINEAPRHLVNSKPLTLASQLKQWWQLAFEYSYFDQVLTGIVLQPADIHAEAEDRHSFQAYFCIDDREESIRRHVEILAPDCQTLGTPAHFNLPIFYRPAGGKFNTQVCPAPISPQHIIVDDRGSEKKRRDLHFHQSSHSWFSGWMIAQTMGFWSAVKLFFSVFRPTISPGHSSSFEHMSHRSNLIIENIDGKEMGDLKVGFTVHEMCILVHSELTRTGLVANFAPLVYMFGHGGSSTNNPYYAGYNCGACSGRPSSLNARVFASIANRSDVRLYLESKEIYIPDDTQFIGGLHDTTRDEFAYYDEELLSTANSALHKKNQVIFKQALANNAKERARQFIAINLKKSTEKIHKEIKKRSVALFEPRPELNHSNNCLCIVGRRSLTRNLFLDQRSFLNSYNWELDQNGDSLLGILGAATPVCGGINLEYFFSRVDNENFGAGSKLPHNVVGLFGVSNGIEGDLRTGLPKQMIDVHDPLRLMMIVEQKPEVVMSTIEKNPSTLEWYTNGWVNLAIIDPETNECFIFWNDELIPYTPLQKEVNKVTNLDTLFETSSENLPVLNLN